MTNERSEGMKAIYLNATIEEYFPPMTKEELMEAPKLKLSKTTHDFGKITMGSVVETVVMVTNEGKNDLMIRSTQSNCDCVVATVENNVLKSGESTKMKLTFDTKSRKGKQYKNVTIFSNDPNGPTQMVTIKAEL